MMETKMTKDEVQDQKKKEVKVPEIDLDNDQKAIIVNNPILVGLLKNIEPVNFAEYLEVNGDGLKQKHIIYAVVRKLLEIAEHNKWNLGQKDGFIYIYNGQFWAKL